jgi:lipoprotein-anchoring transpeptidase ErfK/SrfK
MKRRSFLKGGLSVSALAAATPLLAHDELIPDYALAEELLPREVTIKAGFVPFEVHVDPGQFSLYWTLPDNKALRYKVGIGRPGLYEAGEFFVGARKEWPSWTPTPAMIRRQPDQYARFSIGLAGGINNPLGARALYLFQPGRGDTFLRIHGTNDPSTLVRACRMAALVWLTTR